MNGKLFGTKTSYFIGDLIGLVTRRECTINIKSARPSDVISLHFCRRKTKPPLLRELKRPCQFFHRTLHTATNKMWSARDISLGMLGVTVTGAAGVPCLGIVIKGFNEKWSKWALEKQLLEFSFPSAFFYCNSELSVARKWRDKASPPPSWPSTLYN